MVAARTELPVDSCLPQLGEALASGGTAILTAEPGAGKTTRVPLFLADQDWCAGKVIVLEPRRIAARAAARYVAAGLGERPGETVGYRVRLESVTSAKTRVEYVTEGVFTRQALDDPELAGISVIIFDEFHERSLEADLGLALALDIQSALRPDLKILVMSATLEIDRLSAFLGGAPVIDSPGRSFPVDIEYRQPSPEQRIEDAMAQAVNAALGFRQGSILAFLPGQAEIRRTAELLDGRLPADTDLYPLHGGLEPKDQDAAIQPSKQGKRKVVLATAIAETSLTIEGVTIVIDSGLSRVPRFEPATGLTRLETVPASKFSITQRAGRAGRTAPGHAVRLWQERQTSALPDAGRPEILEADLSPLALDLAAWGVNEPDGLRWLNPPPAAAWAEAILLLKELGALDEAGRITETGKHMREMPLAPRYGRMVLAAAEHGQAEEAAKFAMLISERGLGGNTTDLATRLERFEQERGQRAEAARKSAERMVQNLAKAKNSDDLSPGALLSLAWPDRIAQARGRGSFQLANGRAAQIDVSENLSKARFLVVADLAGKAASARIVSAAEIGEDEVEALHSAAIRQEREITFDERAGAVRAQLVRRLGALTFAASQVKPTAEEASAGLMSTIRRRGLALLGWDKSASRLRRRIAFLHTQAQDEWPDVGDKALLETLEDWLEPFLATVTAVSDIKPRMLIDGLDLLLGKHGRSAAEIGRLLPDSYATPAGSNIALRYEAGEVVLPVRVQELYGLSVHPSIANGSIPLTLELLSPAHRPIQVTRDLPGFWAGSWKEVRTEMRGRYPKHFWPEDPASAAPTTRAKPRGQ